MDPHQLILNPPVEIRGFERHIADQIISRRKAKAKLPSWLEHKSIIYPPPLSMEQSSSEATAAFKSGIIKGDHLVDLTGGMGVDCLHLSQNFNRTTYIEKDPWLCDLFHHNQMLFDRKIEVVNSLSQDFIESLPDDADISFFVDPARRDDLDRKVVSLRDSTPDVTALLPALLKKGKDILIKASPLMDITAAIRHLDRVRSVYVVAVKNEVKELLFLIEKKWSGEPSIHCINIKGDIPDYFEFTSSAENTSTIRYAEAGKYLYDPNAAILKAGAFKSIGNAYNLDKISANTHLYTSGRRITDFPGRVFEVISPQPSKKELQDLHQANVIVKNYPSSAEQVKNRYRITDGGDFSLVAFRTSAGRSRLVICR